MMLELRYHRYFIRQMNPSVSESSATQMYITASSRTKVVNSHSPVYPGRSASINTYKCKYKVCQEWTCIDAVVCRNVPRTSYTSAHAHTRTGTCEKVSSGSRTFLLRIQGVFFITHHIPFDIKKLTAGCWMLAMSVSMRSCNARQKRALV